MHFALEEFLQFDQEEKKMIDTQSMLDFMMYELASESLALL